jgi:hypothetical protein
VTADKMKDAVIAKLSSQCEELYVEVLKLFQKELLRPLWDKEWIPIVSMFIDVNSLAHRMFVFVLSLYKIWKHWDHIMGLVLCLFLWILDP